MLGRNSPIMETRQRLSLAKHPAAGTPINAIWAGYAVELIRFAIRISGFPGPFASGINPTTTKPSRR